MYVCYRVLGEEEVFVHYGVPGGEEVELVSVDVWRLAAEHSLAFSNDRFLLG